MISIFQHRRSVAAMTRLYNRIFRFYGRVEKWLDPKITTIVQTKIATIPDISQATILEYCCGSGLLSLKLAPLCKSVTSKDISFGMLQRAKIRAKETNLSVSFLEGNILDIKETANSYDYVFVSFALHLFSPEKEIEILKQLCTVAKKAVYIIDHTRKWSLGVAITEWLEGSYYDKFIKLRFEDFVQEIGCVSCEEWEMEDCTVLCFKCG